MGHRALVAYERSDSLYNLHYSHWGGLDLQLKHEIPQNPPFGGSDALTDKAKHRFNASLERYDLEDYENSRPQSEQPTTIVDPAPRDVALTRDEIISAYLDFETYEAFYVVTGEFEVTAYRVFWFGLQDVCETVNESPRNDNGALQTVRWHDGRPVGDGPLRGRFEALKDIAGDLIDDGVLTPDEATAYLIEKIGEWKTPQEELIIRTPS